MRKKFPKIGGEGKWENVGLPRGKREMPVFVLIITTKQHKKLPKIERKKSKGTLKKEGKSLKEKLKKIWRNIDKKLKKNLRKNDKKINKRPYIEEKGKWENVGLPSGKWKNACFFSTNNQQNNIKNYPKLKKNWRNMKKSKENEKM